MHPFAAKPFFLLLFLASFFISCEDNKPPANNEESPIQNTPTTDGSFEAVKNALPLLMAHATNSSEGSEVIYLFDKKVTTLWQSLPGTGPGEVIHLIFNPQKEQYVDKIQVLSEAGAHFLAINDIHVEVNNNYLGVFKGNTEIPIKKNLTSLRIQTGLTGGLNIKSAKDASGQIITFPHEKTIGISEIRFWDEKGQPLEVIPPQHYFGAIQASPALQSIHNHPPDCIMDGQLDRAWIMDQEGQQENLNLTFSINGIGQVDQVVLFNGNQLAPLLFSENAMVKKLVFRSNSGASKEFTLRQTPGPQMLIPDQPLMGENFSMEILETYPGSRSQALAISEIIFLKEGLAWNVMAAKEKEKEPDQAPLLSSWINHFHAAYGENDDFLYQKSILLRKDGSFDLQSREIGATGDERFWRANGTWTVKNAGTQMTTLSLLGTLRIVTRDGTETDNFSETITLREDRLSGEAFGNLVR